MIDYHKKKTEERLQALTKQKEQLEANLYKVLGAVELLQAIQKEDADEEKKNKEKSGGSKKIKN